MARRAQAPIASTPRPAASTARAVGALAAATLLVAAPAGCADSGTGPTEKAEATVATLLQTCARGDGEAVLHLLTPPARAELIDAGSVITGCDRLLGLGVESEVEGPTVFGEAVVEEVEVDGDFGTATIRGPSGATSELELENAGDQWLVTNPPL